jgi:N-acyl-D-aspartate/D-glutamate deacylase
MTYDVLIKDGTVVDGTGAPRFRADVAIQDGRIAEIGKIGNGTAKQRIDADGLVVAPGVIDVHTHYDSEVCWDGLIASSAEHGTTTVIQGNCGIGVAPCLPRDREAVLQDLVVLEGMSYEVMSAGIGWQFETFPDYLNFLRRRGLGINVAAFVPLSPMRRYGIGEAAVERGATPDERARIAEHIRKSMEAGALGFSATMVRRQVGHQGKPLPCQLADDAELKAYGNVLRDLGRGAMQMNVIDSIARPTDEELATIDLLLNESGRPVTYSGAMYRNDEPDAIEKMLQKVEPLRQRGARPQTTITPVTLEVGFTSPMVFGDVIAFKKLFNLPLEEQKAIYADPAWRAQAKAELTQGRKLFGGTWASSIVLRVKNEKLKPLLNKSITEIAEERGGDPFNVMIDLALEDDLELKILGALVNSNPDHLRQHIKDPRVLLGLHDGGAHVDMIFQAGFPTYMLGHWVRDEQAIELEHAVQRMTSEPADYFGLRDRGRVAVGKAADLMIFNPETVNSSDRPDQVLYDLPGGGMHLFSTPTGMEYVMVNGQVLFEHRKHTGAMPGMIVDGR